MPARLFTLFIAIVAFVCGIGDSARADAPIAYDTFVKGATPQRGLFTIWHKDGKLYLELAANQLDREFVQTIVPASGVGGQGVVYGNTDHLPTEDPRLRAIHHRSRRRNRRCYNLASWRANPLFSRTINSVNGSVSALRERGGNTRAYTAHTQQ